MVVESGHVGDRFARVFGCARQLQRLGAVKGRGKANLARFMRV